MSHYSIGHFLNMINHVVVKNKKKRLAPVSVSFEITKFCNLNCIHCYNKRIKNELNDSKELNTHRIFQIIDEMAELNVLELIVTGGEPFLRKDILDIIRYVKNNTSIILTIQTNGTLFDEKIVKELGKILTKYDSIQISIDGTKKIHDLIRGKGTWKKTMNGLELLCKEGVPIEINLTPTSLNENRIIETVKIVTDINRINKFGASPMALFNKEDMIYLPDIQKMLENERIVMKILKEKGIKYDGGLRGEFCQYHKFVEDELESLKSINLSSELDKKAVQCDAGITKIHITSRGEVFPCVYLQFDNFLMGDLLKNSLREIWEGWDITRTLRNLGDAKCGDCKFLPFCKGGCPGMAYSYYGTIDAPDPRCIYEY